MFSRTRVHEDRDPRAPGRLRRAGGWYMRSTATLVGSGVLLAAILAGAIYLAVVPAPTSGSNARSATPTVAAAPSSAALPPVDPASALCASQTAVSVPPEAVVLTMLDTRWDQLNGALVPRSDTGGPVNTGYPRGCFTRNPEGAIYSLASFFIESSSVPDTQTRIDLIRARASRGGGYQALMDSLQADPGIAATPADQPQVRITGYRWLGYTPDLAQLELQYRRTDGTGAPMPTVVQAVWEANDWLVVVPTKNSDIHQAGSAQATFTPWGPPL